MPWCKTHRRRAYGKCPKCESKPEITEITPETPLTLGFERFEGEGKREKQ